MKCKALKLSIYKNPLYSGCANGGWSDDHDELYVKCDKGPFSVDEDDPGMFELECGYKGSLHLVPCHPPKGGKAVGPMMGGSYAGSSDSRWSRMCMEANHGEPFYGAVAVHDRYESIEEHKALSW